MGSMWAEILPPMINGLRSQKGKGKGKEKGKGKGKKLIESKNEISIFNPKFIQVEVASSNTKFDCLWHQAKE